MPPVSASTIPVAQRIARQLETHIGESSISVLPSMRVLAKMHRVSITTVHQAVKLLQEKGLVEVYRGGRVRVCGRCAPLSLDATPEPAVQRVIADLREKIGNGTFSIGRPLPKVFYYAATINASHHTVTAAYRTLAEENYTHKVGRQWIAGPPVRRHASIQVLTPPVILLLQSRVDFWTDMAQRPFFEQFCRSFQAEVENSRVQLIPALFEERSGVLSVQPAGSEKVLDLIKQLDSHYRGSLIINAEKEVPHLRNWIGDLSHARRPVAWFDRLKENPAYSFSPRFFTRCHDVEEKAVDLAIDLLADLGHRKIAFPVLSNESWVHRRSGFVSKSARKAGTIDLIACPSGPDSLFWSGDIPAVKKALAQMSQSPVNYIVELTTYLDENGTDLFPALPQEISRVYFDDRLTGLAMLIHHIVHHPDTTAALFRKQPYLPWIVALTPVLGPALEQGVTAIIAPNDTMAHRFAYWLAAMGVSTPGQVSLISFDNLWFLQHVPVTSVDFGYAYLGFAAFHSIMQDIPIRKDSWGNVAAQPHIVNRGTVGPAPDPRPGGPFAWQVPS